MSNITVLELLQCVFWGIGAILPLVFAALASYTEAERDFKKIESSGFWLALLAASVQATVMIFAYKAGGK